MVVVLVVVRSGMSIFVKKPSNDVGTFVHDVVDMYRESVAASVLGFAALVVLVLTAASKAQFSDVNGMSEPFLMAVAVLVLVAAAVALTSKMKHFVATTPLDGPNMTALQKSEYGAMKDTIYASIAFFAAAFIGIFVVMGMTEGKGRVGVGAFVMVLLAVASISQAVVATNIVITGVKLDFDLAYKFIMQAARGI